MPFVLAVSGLCLLVAAIFRRPLRVFFLAGFTWPIEVIPVPVHVVSLLVPSTSATNGFTQLAQLGASLTDVRNEFLTLRGMAVFYGGITWVPEVRKRREDHCKLIVPA
jgi:ABC-2 type transport system permease protein